MTGRLSTLVLVLLILTGIVLVVWAFWWEPGRLVVQQDDVPLADWPAAHDGFRVALLADLHAGSPRNGIENLRRVVDRTNALEPNLVLILGDIVIDNVLGGDWVSPEDVAAELARLTPTHGTFAVLGNHDRWLSAERVTEAYGTADIPVVDNRALRVELGGPGSRDGAAFWVAGVSDYWTSNHNADAAMADVAEHEGSAGEPVFVITHNPDIFPELPDRVSLAMAGHTHGGQVKLPFLGRPIVPSRFDERYADGLIREDGRSYYVSSGVGTSRIGVRFGVPPEISLLILRAAGAP